MKAILWFSFGGPETPDEIWPFLERVTAGRGVPRERLALVREQYLATGGSSPINAQNRKIISDLQKTLIERGVDVPVYFGNRNTAPFLSETVAQMAGDGVTDALVMTTSAFGSYSGCRQYQDDLVRAAPAFSYTKLPPWAMDPGGAACFVEVLNSFLAAQPDLDWATTRMIVTAHSIPTSMAATAPYEDELDSIRLVLQDALTQHTSRREPVLLSYQSRSGDPRTPWLEPDVAETISELAREGMRRIVVFPIGFLTDHQEVLYDLDILARQAAQEARIEMLRLPTVSAAKGFIPLMADYVGMWLEGTPFAFGADSCGKSCCTLAQRPS